MTTLPDNTDATQRVEHADGLVEGSKKHRLTWIPNWACHAGVWKKWKCAFLPRFTQCQQGPFNQNNSKKNPETIPSTSVAVWVSYIYSVSFRHFVMENGVIYLVLNNQCVSALLYSPYLSNYRQTLPDTFIYRRTHYFILFMRRYSNETSRRAILALLSRHVIGARFII